jgi:outer membrane immunogenic protein
MRWQISIALIVLLAAAAGAAHADGYQPRRPTSPYMQTTNWTGFYANGGVGYGLWDAETTTDAPGGACVSCAKTDHAGRGWLGEIGLGYDYQFTDKIVGGVLFNYDFSDMQGRLNDSVFTTGKTSNDSTWFVGARAGWLMTPDVLNYWSVGYTQTHFGGASLNNSFSGAPAGGRLGSYDAGGWFVGGGLEVAMHGGWFWRSEVRYADYSKDVRAETLGGAPLFNLNFDPVVETATSAIVYKFDWGR